MVAQIIKCAYLSCGKNPSFVVVTIVKSIRYKALRLKVLKTDGGGQHPLKEFSDFCEAIGIEHEITPQIQLNTMV